MKTDTSTLNLGIEQFPENTHDVLNMMKTFVDDYNIEKVLMVGQVYPWAYGVMSTINRGRMDAVWCTDKLTDADTQVFMDLLSVNSERNRVRKSMDLPQLNLHCHVRPADLDLKLDTAFEPWGFPELLVVCPTGEGGSVQETMKILPTSSGWRPQFVLCIIPQKKSHELETLIYPEYFADIMDLAESMNENYTDEIYIAPIKKFGSILFVKRN